MTGERLDRFELIAELASGGMGAVFLARLGGAGGFQRLYAIKRLHEHLARHGEFIEMFLDEARLAASIHHPNVVPILEIGTTSAGYYLVMEYIEGDTMGHLFQAAVRRERRMPVRVSLRIAIDVLAGLHAAHDRADDDGRPLEIVHRDVSPHNILVGTDGVARITDFGIARAATRLSVTRSGQLKGKLAYMAPEQARSEKVDRRADVFAMGICLWEMLTGERLFKAEAEGDTLNRLLYEPIPTPRSVDPDIEPELDDVCMKALTRDPDARFRTAAEFSDALESAGKRLDLLGSNREVAACVSDLVGAELAERRASLRAWLGESERRSLLPPGDSSGNLGSGPGAAVSVYVPPLLDSGMLPYAGAAARSPSTSRRRRIVAGAVAAFAGVAIITLARIERHPAKVVATPEPLVARTPAQPPPLVSARMPPPVVATALPEPVIAETRAAPTANTPPHARSPARPSTRSAADSAKQSRASTPGAGSASGTAASKPQPADSVPPDMVFNPYR
ncbi:MAG: serine/threonine protein kinase [Polyangiaceae bacterium]